MKEAVLVGGPNCGLVVGGVKRGEKSITDAMGYLYSKSNRLDGNGRAVFTFNQSQKWNK